MQLMIANLYKKVKIWCVESRNDLIIACIIFFTGLSGFGLGRLSVDLKPHPPFSVIQPINEQDSNKASSGVTADTAAANDKKIVASRNGTAYYYPWCSGAKRIKEENKVWFLTKEAAEKAGLKLAGNCIP